MRWEEKKRGKAWGIDLIVIVVIFIGRFFDRGHDGVSDCRERVSEGFGE